MLYFDQFLDSKWFFVTPNDFFDPQKCGIYCSKIRLFSDFAVRMVKQENFLKVVNLSFEVRFAKYYHFVLH